MSNSETDQNTGTIADPVSIVNADGSYADNWYEKYGKENEAHLSRYKTHDDLVNSHIATKRKFGKDPNTLIEIPTEHSSEEVRAAFRKASGVPDTTDDYKYTLSDELAVKLGPLQDDKMEKVRKFAHKELGLSPDKFVKLLDFYHSEVASDIDLFGQQTTEQAAKDAEKTKAELRKMDGWRSEEEYNAKVQRAQSVMEKYGGEEAVAELNLQNNIKMIKLFDSIAESMSEATLKGTTSSSASSVANINSQIIEIRSQMDAVIKENPVNFKNNSKYKELTQRKSELYKKMLT